MPTYQKIKVLRVIILIREIISLTTTLKYILRRAVDLELSVSVEQSHSVGVGQGFGEAEIVMESLFSRIAHLSRRQFDDELDAVVARVVFEVFDEFGRRFSLVIGLAAPLHEFVLVDLGPHAWGQFRDFHLRLVQQRHLAETHAPMRLDHLDAPAEIAVEGYQV